MSTQETRAVAEALYEAFLAGDAEGMLAQLHEEAEVAFLGQGCVRGTQQVRELFEFLGGQLAEVEFTLDQLVVDGSVAAGIWRERAVSVDGETWENHGVDLIHVHDGRVVALHENNDVRREHPYVSRYRPGAQTRTRPVDLRPEKEE